MSTRRGHRLLGGCHLLEPLPKLGGVFAALVGELVDTVQESFGDRPLAPIPVDRLVIDLDVQTDVGQQRTMVRDLRWSPHGLSVVIPCRRNQATAGS